MQRLRTREVKSLLKFSVNDTPTMLPHLEISERKEESIPNLDGFLVCSLGNFYLWGIKSDWHTSLGHIVHII